MSGETNLKATIVATPPSGPGPELTGVGVCLSGGGSRALTAGLGQLRALAHLNANGESLLSQVTALSTVSGGSWLGVPWVYLPRDVSDERYLNGYVADPGRLVLSTTHGHSQAETLDQLPDGNPGHDLGYEFSIPDMLFEMISLRLAHGTPWNMMWQIIIARRILAPYGLYSSGDNAEPTSLFSLDATTLKDDVVSPNNDLAGETAHLVAVADGPGRMKRPFLICNSSMFVSEPGSEFEFLAPVQATPLSTGIVGVPDGVDANDRLVGGGSVTSFAFGSALTSIDGAAVDVAQERQLSLTDIVGISSAAFAEMVQNYLEDARKDPSGVHQDMLRRRENLLRRLKKHAKPEHHDLFSRVFDELKVHVIDNLFKEISPKGLIPHYRYWPVRDAQPNPDIVATRFADGGSLENTGIAAILSHHGIDRIIAFVNSPDKLVACETGIIGPDGNEVEGTRVNVAGELPVLFGYRPHQDDVGYVPFAPTPDHDLGDDRIFKHNQVFKSTAFADLLQGLAAAAGTPGGDDLQTRPAIFKQTLDVLENDWFGVKEKRRVTVVWVYLNEATAWRDLLADDVRRRAEAIDKFPNYSTASTELDATEVNLLASQTAWCVANDDNAEVFVDLFNHS